MKTFVILLFWALMPGVASAQSGPPGSEEAGSNQAGSKQAGSKQAGVEPPGFVGLSRADQREIALGWARLPPRVLARAGSVTFRAAPGSCPHAMGAYTRSCPTWSATGEFLIYPGVSVAGEVARTRTAQLSDQDLRRLLLQRAAVHAGVARADARARWSQRDAWRRLNLWRSSDRAFNHDEWGFSRPLGMRSAHLDLVTFAEEFFVPAGDGALSARCQEFTKSRFVATAIVRQPTAQMSFPTGCESFDRWANLDELDDIELLFAAATADRPQSLWGHLLLHLRYTDLPEGMEPVYQFGAITDSDVGPIDYLSRGLMGGFGAVFDPQPFRTVDRVFMQAEQRSLRRFRLQLSRAESLRVLQRIWEMERRHRYPYWFFDENCAAFIVDLLRAADLEEPLGPRGSFVVAPTDVLDHLAPVVERVFPDHSSNRTRAHRSRATRAELLQSLPGEVAKHLKTDIESSLNEDWRVRRASHRMLGTSLERLVRNQRLSRADAYSIAHHSAVIERFFLEREIVRARAVIDSAATDQPARSARELLERRRELYRHEDLDRRMRQRRDRDFARMETFRELPRRDFTTSETEVVETEQGARKSWEAATRTLRTIAGLASARARARLDAAAVNRESSDARQHDALSERSSGDSRTSVALGHDLDFGPQIALSASAFSDRLGVPRRRGVRPDVEIRGLGLDVASSLTQAPDDLRVEATVVRYLTLARSLEMVSDSVWDAFGYGFDVELLHDQRFNIDFAARARAGVVFPVAASAHATSHLVLLLMPAFEWAVRPDPTTSLGLRVGAMSQLHLFGRYGNVWFLRGHATPVVRLERARFETEIEVVTGFRFVAAEVDGRWLTLSPQVQWEATPNSNEARSAWVVAELPF